MAEAAFLYFPPYKADSLSVEQIAGGQDSLFASSTILVTQIWFAKLISYLESPPREIPIRADLLTQAQGRIWHPCPRIWRLWVWPLSGDL